MPDPKRPFKISFTSELMKNQVPATVFSPHQAMHSVYDAAGEPLLFSIGTDGVLNVVVRSTENHAGWDTFPLTPTADDQAVALQATTFAVTQLPNGLILLAVVMAPRDGVETKETSLYVLSAPLSNDASVTDWSDLQDQWVPRPHPEGKVVIAGIRLGAGTEKNLPLGVATARGPDAASAEKQWMFNADGRETKWMWELFEMPLDVGGHVELATGMVQGVRGAYALYETGAGQTLVFRSLPDEIFRRSLYVLFTLPAKINALRTLPTEGDSDLYVAGAGLYVFPGSHEAPQLIAPADRLPEVHELVVTQDPSAISVFALAGDGLVFHCEGTQAKDGTWGKPLQILSGANRIAAARNTNRVTNQIFATKGAGDLIYLYQDPDSTLWKETEIRLPSPNRVAEFMTYTTHVRFTDAADRVLVAQDVEVTAESWTHLFLNGTLHGVDAETPVVVCSDVAGDLTIVSEAMDLSSSVLTLRIKGEADSVVINPAAGVQHKLAAVQDFAQETLSDGKPLLSETQRQDTQSCANVKSGMQGLLAGPPRKRTMATGEPAGAPEGAAWGMSFVGGQVLYHEHRVLPRLTMAAGGVAAGDSWFPSLDDWAQALRAKAGDCLQWMYEKLQEGVQIFFQVAGEAFELLIKVGEQVLKCIVKGVETTMKVVGWMLEKAFGIDLDKLWQWLGFLFAWEDIKRSRDAITATFTRFVEIGKANLHSYQAPVTAFFQGLKDKVRQLSGVGDDGPVAAAGQRDYDNRPAGGRDQTDKVQTSPGNNWAQHHFLHSGGLAMVAPAVAAPSSGLSDLISKTIQPALDGVRVAVEQLGQDFLDLFNSGTATAQQLIAKLLSHTAINLLDVLENVAIGMLQFAEEVIGLTATALTAPIQIPFFSAFYKQHFSGKDLSILDLVALMAAIPATMAFKLATGKPPFPAGSNPMEGLDDVFKLLQVSPPAVHSPMALAGAAAGDGPHVKLSDAEIHYSIWGGFIYIGLSCAGDLTTVVMSWSEMAKALGGEGQRLVNQDEEKKVLKLSALEWFTFGTSMVKSAFSLPVGREPQVKLQLAAWGLECYGAIAQTFIPYVVGRLKLPDVLGYLSAKTIAQSTLKTLFTLPVFVLENIVYWKFEGGINGASDDENLKYFQNLSYFVNDLGEIVLPLMPAHPAKYAGMAGAIVATVLATGLNLMRCIRNGMNWVAHPIY